MWNDVVEDDYCQYRFVVVVVVVVVVQGRTLYTAIRVTSLEGICLLFADSVLSQIKNGFFCLFVLYLSGLVLCWNTTLECERGRGCRR